MVWNGRARTTRQLHAPQVRLGDFVMPTQAIHEFTGDLGEPDLFMEFEVRDGRPECVEVRLTVKPDGRGLRTSDLQVLGLDALKTGVFSQLAMRSTFDPVTNVTRMEPVTDEREMWRAINEVDAAVKAPKRGITQAELEQVAKIYRENVKASPVKAVQMSLGYNSERTAARRVELAREAGLLPATTPGKRKA